MDLNKIKDIRRQLRDRAYVLKGSAYANDHQLMSDAASAIDRLLDAVLEEALKNGKYNAWSDIPSYYPDYKKESKRK